MKQLFSRRARDLAAARQAELRGDLTRATELFNRANAREDVARVMMLRADAEPDPRARLQYFVQAAAAAPDDSAVKRDARIRRARTSIALAKGSVISAAVRMDVISAAKELEDLGEAADAADAYRTCGDRDAEARALAAAGKIDELEALLDGDQAEERAARAKRERSEAIDEAIATGRRRDALVLIERATHADAGDRDASQRGETMRAKRIRGPIVAIEIRGKTSLIALGHEIVIGRTEGSIQIPSHAVSRRHLRVARRDDAVYAFDLESRNGTTLRGIPIANELAVNEGVELSLGNEVPVRIAPCDDLPGAVFIEIGGARYVAPLGPARLGIGDWELAVGADDWVELRFASTPAFSGNVTLASPTTLLTRDAFSTERGGPVILELATAVRGEAVWRS